MNNLAQTLRRQRDIAIKEKYKDLRDYLVDALSEEALKGESSITIDLSKLRSDLYTTDEALAKVLLTLRNEGIEVSSDALDRITLSI